MKKRHVYCVGALLLVAALLSVGCTLFLDPVPVEIESLTITVLDETGAAVTDAAVTFGAGGATETTDASGQVEFVSVQSGEYEVTVAHGTNGEVLTRTISIEGDAVDFQFAKVVSHPDPSMEYPLGGNNWSWAHYFNHTGGAWITDSSDAYSGTAFIRNPQGDTNFWIIFRPDHKLPVEIGKHYRPTLMVRNNGDAAAEVVLWFLEGASPNWYGANPVTVPADGQWHRLIGGNVGVADAELLHIRADFEKTDQLDFDHIVVYEVLNY